MEDGIKYKRLLPHTPDADLECDNTTVPTAQHRGHINTKTITIHLLHSLDNWLYPSLKEEARTKRGIEDMLISLNARHYLKPNNFGT